MIRFRPDWRGLSVPILSASLLVLALGVSPAPAQNKGQTLSEAEARKDADYAVQGEYVGKRTAGDDEGKVGLQLVAQGQGKFIGVAYPGGLPGAGWTGKEKIPVTGTRKGNIVELIGGKDGAKGSGTWKDGRILYKDEDGNSGTFKRVVRVSPTMGAKAPKEAVVLFDGSTAKHFKGGRLDKGLLREGVTSFRNFGDFHLHMEFKLNYAPSRRGQGRSNSGIYMQGRYEMQILDSFGLAGKHNECGGIYEIKDPALNMCLPPLQWQTYDIDFIAARYDKAGKKTANARLTARHNGVLIHKNVDVPRSTRASPVREGVDLGPVYIQNHANPLHFRNIWLVEKREAGFVPVFNGKTLAGWHKNPEKIGHGTGGSWKVENGVIAGEQDPPGSGIGGILLTVKTFGDFELLIDMKPDWGVCSGLFVRSNNQGQCFQMMVDYHDDGNVGHIYGEGTGGFNTRTFDIFGKYNDKKELVSLTTKPTKVAPPKAFTISGNDWVSAWKVGDWNTARLRVVGSPPQITTWINGRKVNEFNGRTFPGKGYDKVGITKLLGAKGRVAVQVHGGKGWPKGAKCRWRNVYVRELN